SKVLDRREETPLKQERQVMKRKFTLAMAAVALLSVAILSTGCQMLKARDELNKGVTAYKNAKYADAVERAWHLGRERARLEWHDQVQLKGAEADTLAKLLRFRRPAC
ncbi:MAG TPA: hypothetical protein PK264_16820, partial [Hyphomicrobiaceae bacterium]|nr:hypothetical protein [Hyphomicrobiaceae bacterium]